LYIIGVFTKCFIYGIYSHAAQTVKHGDIKHINIKKQVNVNIISHV